MPRIEPRRYAALTPMSRPSLKVNFPTGTGDEMRKWLQKRRERRNREIAKAVYAELLASQGWEKFLPPVALRDKLYMVTENGSIYALDQDLSGMERITQIRPRP